MYTIETIPVVQNVLHSNDELAAANARRLHEAGVFAVNLMASPGAGKTSIILRTLKALAGRKQIGVIEGDTAGRIDTERVLAAGAHAVQINTNGGCHLEAEMIAGALDHFDLPSLDLLFIENVGNLICPTYWMLGEGLRVVIASVAEGDDKPIKYPRIFELADVVLLNKIDLLHYVDFSLGRFYDGVRALNVDARIFETDCRRGRGIDDWVDHLLATAVAYEPATAGEPA